MTATTEWIAVDWGTTRLRTWAMRGDEVMFEASSDKGLSRLTPEDYEPALLELIEPWLGPDPVDVLACGMVGARQGWHEAPYSTVPVHTLSEPPVRVPGTDPRIRAFVLPGVRQLKPADVMRGEETQVAGFLNRNRNWDGVICLPGTHTKWVQVSADEIVSFRTFMTGELFELLSKGSILRHSVTDGWDAGAFSTAVDDVLSRPEALAGQLFGLRATDLLEGAAPGVARARLSGLLIGAELAAARPYWLGQQIAVIGAPQISQTYAAALDRVGAQAALQDAQAMTLAGLSAARAMIGATK